MPPLLSARLQNKNMADSELTGRQQRGVRLLSLDGGGIRGLSSLIILKLVLENYQTQNKLVELPKPYQVFDLAGGTSTGGLIVIMLFRLKMSIVEAIDTYVGLTKQVFSEKKWIFQNGSFKATRLEEAIVQVIKAKLKIDSDEEARQVRLLDENSPKCFVCSATAVNLSSPTLFRSWKSTRLSSHLRTTIVEAARATSAAPTFFKSVEIVGDEGLPETFVDGGMLANNPVKFVLNQAKEIFPNSNIDYVLSLGTGAPSVIKINVDDSIFKRLLPSNIILVKALAKVATDCESTAEDVERKFSDTPGVYYRLNVNRGLEEVSLSEWAKSNSVATHTRTYLGKEDVHKKVLDLVQKLYQLQEPDLVET